MPSCAQDVTEFVAAWAKVEADVPPAAAPRSHTRQPIIGPVDPPRPRGGCAHVAAASQPEPDSPPRCKHRLVHGAKSDGLRIHVATWNVGNEAPPADLKGLLPQDGSADIIAFCAQESTYSGSTAKEDIIGRLTVTILSASGLRNMDLLSKSDPRVNVEILACISKYVPRASMEGLLDQNVITTRYLKQTSPSHRHKKQHESTPCIPDNLDPVWDTDNVLRCANAVCFCNMLTRLTLRPAQTQIRCFPVVVSNSARGP